MDKPYKTYDEQVELLKSKGLEIPDKDKIVALLKEHSYYGLISGYKAPFKDSNRQYIKHTKIDDIYALYDFDAKLRALVLKYILKTENHIKSLLSYSFCKAYGDDQQQYLNVTNYDYSNPLNQSGINKLVGKLTDIVNNPEQYPYLAYQKNKHQNIPLWALSKALTLGTVSKMYSFLVQPVKQQISKEFDNVNDSQLVRMIDMLSRYRNVCAHNERLYDFKYNKGYISNTAVHKNLGIKRDRKGFYQCGRKDLFAVVIVLKYLLNESDFSMLCDELESIIIELTHNTRLISYERILKEMGFPLNWYDIKTCNKA